LQTTVSALKTSVKAVNSLWAKPTDFAAASHFFLAGLIASAVFAFLAMFIILLGSGFTFGQANKE